MHHLQLAHDDAGVSGEGAKLLTEFDIVILDLRLSVVTNGRSTGGHCVTGAAFLGGELKPK